MTTSIDFIAKVPFPPDWKLYGGVQPSVTYLDTPNPTYPGAGVWLIVASGSYPGRADSFGVYAFVWLGGSSVAQVVPFMGGANRIATGRGAAGPSKDTMFTWSIDGGGDLVVHRVGGAPTLEAKVDALRAEVAAVGQRVAALEGSSGGLTEQQQDDLRWVAEVRAIV